MKDFIIFDGWIHGYIENGVMSEMGNYWLEDDEVWDALCAAKWCVIYKQVPGWLRVEERYYR